MDFGPHNEEQAAVWASLEAGKPTRVPMTVGRNVRMMILDPALNRRGYTFEKCYKDPALMFEAELEFQHWYFHAIPADMPRGLPDKWVVTPGFQDNAELGWFGAPLFFRDNQVPDTPAILQDDNKRMLFDQGIPDPFANLMGEAQEFLQYYQDRAPKETFYGRPVEVEVFEEAWITEGPFTLACALRGPTEFCIDLYEDPDYAQELLTFLVEATVTRQRAWRKYQGLPVQLESYLLSDDSIQMLSPETYRQLVLPYHKRLLSQTAAPGARINVHLCGDASHLFAVMRKELGVVDFDTGFPVDHGRVRCELGPEVWIHGGPHINLVLRGSPEELAVDTQRILQSGVMKGGRFVLHTEPPPGIPIANLQAMYNTCRQYGRYP
jgi:hypothetical protein